MPPPLPSSSALLAVPADENIPPPGGAFRNRVIEEALRPILPRVEKPGRYIGLERNTVVKDPATVRLRFCMAFPDTYEIGMSHTGLKVLYHLLNRRGDTACERAYAPWIDMDRAMTGAEIPLFTVESLSPVKDFHVLGFSLQSELNYTNIPNMLRLAGIPILSGQRREGDTIVIGGGPCTANPEPLADFFDAFLIGDAEEALLEFADSVSGSIAAGLSRDETLLRIAQIPGWYVPAFYDVTYGQDGILQEMKPNRPGIPARIARRWVETLTPDVYPAKPIVPSVEIVQERLGLEIMRGCTQGCRFCQAGYWYRPVRELDPADVIRMTKDFVNEAGWSEISLLSLSTADYSQIEPLAGTLSKELAPQRVSISLPSLRADAFNVTLADAVSEVRKSGFTFAPETGSDRLRRVINKSFTNADMIAAAEVAFSRGWDLIKIYTMIGLPTETDQDLDELVILVENILKVARKTPGRKEVKVSVGCLVPKTWTPFQWDKFDGVPELKRKINYLRDKFRRVRGARMTNHDPHEAEIEAILSRGDRRLGRAIARAVELGATFDGWTEQFRYDLWCRALEETGCDRAFYTREISEKETLPWDILDISITKKFLQIERKKGLREMETEDCKWGHCYACGIPGLGEDTVLANPMSLPAFPAPAVNGPAIEVTMPEMPAGLGVAAASRVADPASPAVSSGRKSAALRRAELEAKREGKARQAPYRLRETPELPPRPRTELPGFRKNDPGPVHRARLHFSKAGDYRFLSHRNVMDCLERALRAAAIPMRYTEGYNPHLRMSMGPALPLGQECERDPFEIETVEPFTAAHFDAVNLKLPDGIRLVAWKSVREGAKSLGKISQRGLYRIGPSETFGGNWASLVDQAAEFLSTSSAGGLAVRGDGTFGLEIPLSGEGATSPKKLLEQVLGLTPDQQLDLRIVREEVRLVE